MVEKNIENLIAKYQAGKCSAEEKSILLSHFNTWLGKSESGLSPEKADQLNEDTWKAICDQININKRITISTLLWKKTMVSITVAAAVLITGWLILKVPFFSEIGIANQSQHDIVPLYNGAHLTFENGTSIELEGNQKGVDFSSDKIIYNDGTSLETNRNISNERYLLSTPKGSTYQVILSDGTRIILNGGSEIKYPGKFGEGDRVVELQGEAYFSVEKSAGASFIVKTEGQEVKVLGTEFNIAAYDLSAVKTTLVEGSVEIKVNKDNKSPFILKPGEQSIVSRGGRHSRKQVNLKKELAWQSGVFYFENTPFSEVLQQVSQWYDVDVIYTSGVPFGTFSGIIDRKVSLRTLLEYFEESSQYQFTLENEKLKVQK